MMRLPLPPEDRGRYAVYIPDGFYWDDDEMRVKTSPYQTKIMTLGSGGGMNEENGERKSEKDDDMTVQDLTAMKPKRKVEVLSLEPVIRRSWRPWRRRTPQRIGYRVGETAYVSPEMLKRLGGPDAILYRDNVFKALPEVEAAPEAVDLKELFDKKVEAVEKMIEEGFEAQSGVVSEMREAMEEAERRRNEFFVMARELGLVGGVQHNKATGSSGRKGTGNESNETPAQRAARLREKYAQRAANAKEKQKRKLP